MDGPKGKGREVRAVIRFPSPANGEVAGRGYQVRFLLSLSFIFAFGALLLFAVLFLFFSRPLEGSYSSVFFALRNLTEFAFPIVSFSALVYVLLVCGATAVLCVYTLHKVAGPLYRMARVTESYIAGDAVRRVSFREGDQATVLATAFNALLARLREDRTAWASAIDRAEEALRSDPAAGRREMETAAGEILSGLSRFR
jgi:methyl-accepting chemotaxis protein